jgi:dephospho-CoA kinase
MIVIGITGTLGAGKGTIVEYLIEKRGFVHFSVRGFLVKELEKRGMPVNRDTMTSLANELRAQHSPSYITDELYMQAKAGGKNSVIESIRTPGEITSLRAKGNFYLFAVDADPRVRFERIKLRKSSTDNIDYETFLANEKREMTATDPNKQNLSKCISEADFVFDNNGDLETLYKQLEQVLNKLGI